MKRFFLLLYLAHFFQIGITQKKQITLEDLWEKRTFSAKGIAEFTFSEDGNSFIQLKGNKIIKYDIASNKEVETMFDGELVANGQLKNQITNYQLSTGGGKLLIETLPQPIYRYSSTGIYYVYSIEKKTLMQLNNGNRIMYPQFSPDGQKIAFVCNNNLYYQDLATAKIRQVTKNGLHNHIINGASDWVYEEEFGLTRAFIWSPNSDQLVYLSFDESKVPLFYMEYFRNETYPVPYTFKYPKVDQQNASVSIHHYSLRNNKSRNLNIASCQLKDAYLPRIQWTNDNNVFCFIWINRLQNHLKLVSFNTANQQETVLVEEQSDYYIDIHDHLIFLKNGKSFIWTSEKSGSNQIYLVDIRTQRTTQLTQGSDEVTDCYGLDEDEQHIFFQKSAEGGLERKVYRQRLGETTATCLTPDAGTHSAMASPGCKYLLVTSSTLNSPPQYRFVDESGMVKRTLEDNAALKAVLDQYALSAWNLFKIPNRHGDSLHAVWLLPADFDQSKKYPVLMHLYGGPGSQKVIDRWNATGDQFWFQMLAQQGYIVCVVDNRGTGGRGEHWKKMTYKQLGKLETEDQIDAAKWLGALPFVEASRIGVFGWSYGGYLSSLCILKGNDVFKAAIAVAPVTHWKWYDTIYTERYMQGYSQNKEGYDENSPILFADRLRGHYLLVHGMGDDNVHFQHTAEMANALIKNKKQFDTYFYPNRHHGITGDNARYHLYEKMTNFVKTKI